MCESRGGHPGLHVPNNPYGLCERKATLDLEYTRNRSAAKHFARYNISVFPRGAVHLLGRVRGGWWEVGWGVGRGVTEWQPFGGNR